MQKEEIDKNYLSTIQLQSFLERLEYLRLHSDNPGNINRKLMNNFYKSWAWQQARDFVIHRDLGCDLGVPNLFIEGPILVHHISPIAEDDVINGDPKLTDPNNLICVSYDTHNKIHYKDQPQDIFIERKPGDTKLW